MENFKKLVVLTLVVLLSGCATGIVMTDEEAATCKTDGCTVWTDKGLDGLAKKFWIDGAQKGYEKGYVDGYKSI